MRMTPPFYAIFDRRPQAAMSNIDHTLGMPKALLGLALFAATLAVLSCEGGGKPEGDGVAAPHLRPEARVEYYLNKEANDLTETVVRETFERWGEATRFDFVYKGRHRAGLRKDGKNTVSFLVKWPSEIPIGKAAYCKNWYDRKGNIVESDIIFNMMATRFTTLRTNTPGSYYIEGILAHEIGHLIGIDHIEEEDCLMKSFSPQGESYFMGRIDEKTLGRYRELYAKKSE